MDLKYIKSTLLSNFTSQVKTRVMTITDTLGKQQQGWPHLLKDGIGIFFTSCLELIAILISLIILSVILLPILICMGISLVNLTKTINRLEIESLHYYYEQDIEYILSMVNDKLSFDDLFTSKIGQHPPIIKYLLSKKINIETLIILDDILRFSKRLNRTIKEKVIWPKLYERMIRYKPFLKYNITKFKMTLKKKVKEM